MNAASTMLDALLGEWRGTGTVQLPSMTPVAFVETVRFTARDANSLDYWQRAERSGTMELLHSEVGIWRLGGADRLELLIALDGATEVSEGAVVDGTFDAATTSVGRAATHTTFRAARRRYRLMPNGDLAYEADLESANVAMTRHVGSVLRRV